MIIEDMGKIAFIDTIFNRKNKYKDNIEFDYHVRSTDFPILHGHKDYWEFTILTEGTVYNVLNGEKMLCKSPCLFYATTKDEHFIKSASHNKIKYMNILVKESKILPLLKGISPDFEENLYNGKHLFALSQNIVTEITETAFKTNILLDEQYKLRDKLLCYILLVTLQFLYKTMLEEFNLTSQENNSFTQTLSKIMSTPQFASYTVSDLCKIFAYSRMQLNRLFHKHFQKTPHDFLIDFKLTYARSLLLNTDISVKKIAQMIGYSSVSQFSTNFFEKYNVTPNNCRTSYNTVK